MITSTSGRRMKAVRALTARGKERRERGLFVAEGRRLVEEIPAELVAEVYCSESFAAAEEHRPLVARLRPELVSDSVYQSVSETKSPQGILAVVRQPRYELSRLLERDRPLLILESIQDPGNLGTMLRTGEGAGIGGVILSRDTVDLFNSKTVRSTMGSLFRVPFFVADSLEEAVGEVKRSGYRVYAAHLAGKREYTGELYPDRCAFLIGNEGNGLRDETAGLADVLIRIPMEGQVESLNAAIAAALLMYEARRQRS